MANDMLFDALADPTRRRVLQLLGTGPKRAGELAQTARVSPPAMSRHLRILLSAGMVGDERSAADARIRLFRLRPEGLNPVRVWMDALQSEWDAQLESFRRHADGVGQS